MPYQGSEYDEFREAFDIHGEDVQCCKCGATMDSLTVDHYDYQTPILGVTQVEQVAEEVAQWVADHPEALEKDIAERIKQAFEIAAAVKKPVCDRCYWDEYHRTHDPDTGEPYPEPWLCPKCKYELEEQWDEERQLSIAKCENCGHEEVM